MKKADFKIKGACFRYAMRRRYKIKKLKSVLKLQKVVRLR